MHFMYKKGKKYQYPKNYDVNTNILETSLVDVNM